MINQKEFGFAPFPGRRRRRGKQDVFTHGEKAYLYFVDYQLFI